MRKVSRFRFRFFHFFYANYEMCVLLKLFRKAITHMKKHQNYFSEVRHNMDNLLQFFPMSQSNSDNSTLNGINTEKEYQHHYFY